MDNAVINFISYTLYGFILGVYFTNIYWGIKIKDLPTKEDVQRLRNAIKSIGTK